MIRRTRAFVRKTYPEAKIRGELHHAGRSAGSRPCDTTRVHVLWDLRQGCRGGGVTYRLAQYQLETYKRAGVERDEFELGREEALAGIFRSRYLKRFESSVEAFRITLRPSPGVHQDLRELSAGREAPGQHLFPDKSMRYLSSEDEDDDGLPDKSLQRKWTTAKRPREILETL